MRSYLALVRKDVKGYFDQPTGYILIVIFVGLLSYWFFRSALISEEASLRPLFTTDFTVERPSMIWLLALFVPAATMRLLSEEQRDGTMEILLTHPIRGWIVLLAKFVAGLLFVSIAILSTLGIPILLETAGDLDWGAVVAQYVGSIFLAASMVAIGLFTSSLTRNQIVSFILSLFLIMLLMFIGLDRVSVTLPVRLSAVLQTLSPLSHFESIARGVIDLRDVLYFVSLISTFLSATFLMIRAGTLSHRSIQYRNLQLGTIGLIVLSLLVGWFGNSIGGRLDLTEDKIFTLSKGTEQILSDLDDLITVELYQSKNPPVQVSLTSRDVDDFLQDFASGSGGKVKLVHRYPDDDVEAARKAQLAGVPAVQFNVQTQSELQITTGYLGLTMTYADKRETIPFIETIDGFEYRLATLANKMLQDDRKSIGFLTGHGEKSITTDLTSFNTLLSQQYDVIEFSDDGEDIDLDSIDVLIIPGPTTRISDDTQQAIHRYLNNGGKAMIMIDTILIDQGALQAQPNFENFTEFVNRYGVIVEDDLVFDLQSNDTLSFGTQLGSVLLPYPYWMRVPVTDDKVAGSLNSVILPWASSLGITESDVGQLEVIPILESTGFSAINFNPTELNPRSRVFDDVTREQLIVSLMGVALTAPSANGDSAEESFRLVVVGDSDWITDPLVSRSEDNLVLGLNLVDWLAQDDTLAAIRSKVVTTRNLLFTSNTHRNLVQYANIGGVPLAFVVIGLLRWARRRQISLKEFEREK